MSHLISRILLAVLVIPSAMVVYLVAYFVAVDYHALNWNSDAGNVLAGGVTFGFVGVYWSLLWRKSVAWTTARRAWTVGSIFGACVVAVLAAAALTLLDDSFGRFVGSVVGPLAWMIATVFIWRETPAERAARVDRSGRDSLVCPTCGYNLTGLSESRCPECGSKFTLDQLFADQPARAERELEV